MGDQNRQPGQADQQNQQAGNRGGQGGFQPDQDREQMGEREDAERARENQQAPSREGGEQRAD